MTVSIPVSTVKVDDCKPLPSSSQYVTILYGYTALKALFQKVFNLTRYIEYVPRTITFVNHNIKTRIQCLIV